MSSPSFTSPPPFLNERHVRRGLLRGRHRRIDDDDEGDDEESLMKKINTPSPDCGKCMHFRTCVIHRLVGQGLASQFNEHIQSPVRVFDLAKICDDYYLKPDKGEEEYGKEQ